MDRPVAVLVVLLVVGGMLSVAAPAVTGAAGSGVPPGTDFDGAGPATNESASAGEHLAGSLSTHQESIDRNLSQRMLAHRVSRPANDTERARTLKVECDRLDERLVELRNRARQLQEAHDDGSMSTGEFRARMTRLDAEAKTVAELVESCRQEAEKLPEAALDAAGFDPSSIRDVGERVTSFRHTELANRTFNVTRVETGPTKGPDDGSIERSEALIETSARHSFLVQRLGHVETVVEQQAPDDEFAREKLACARRHLDAAEREIEAAREAGRRGDDERFDDHLETARGHLRDAEACIEQAYEEAGT